MTSDRKFLYLKIYTIDDGTINFGKIEEIRKVSMIRFCDRDVYCIRCDALDRDMLFSYFINGRRSNIVCVLDMQGKFAGIITYASLLENRDIYEAVQKNYVLLDEDIWQNGRNFFRFQSRIDIHNGDVIYLPVLDEEHTLRYFAYQDEEANQELRMLWELINMCGERGGGKFY